MRIRQRKTILLMVLPALLWLPALAQLATAGSSPVPKLSVDPSSQIVMPGDVFTIDINIDNIQDLTGFELKLSYNTTILDASDAVIGSFPATPLVWYHTEIQDPDGYVFVSAVFEAVEGSGTLAKVTFEVTCGECVLCPLDVCETALSDSDGYPIDHEVHDGCYLVSSVIPEFPATIVTPLLVVLSLVAAFLAKIVWSRKRRGPSIA